MLFERFEDDSGLSHYSYLVGCPRTGLAAVVDPRRDVDVYETYARHKGLSITYVLETHIHADFASGGRELASRTGAEHWLSAYDDGELFDVSFPHRPMREGEEVSFGGVRIEALHTPGHTPEHISFLVYERDRSQDVPEIMLSGDFLFVGSLGRPDLLGEEAKLGLAHRLFASVRDKLARLPDGVEIHPAHGAGSMCGAGMSGRPMSTLGFERVANPFLNMASEAAFVERILGNVPPFPPYYLRMKQVNSDGPELLGGLPKVASTTPSRFRELMAQGHIVVDARTPKSFGEAHIPGAFSIGASGNSSVWSSWVVPYDRPILLVADDSRQMSSIVRGLVRVGHDGIVGYLEGAMPAWTAVDYPVARTPQISVDALAARLEAGESLHVLDVRGDDEFSSSHIAGAHHIMGGLLPDRIDQVPNSGSQVAIVCRSGYRSSVAGSVLERAGFSDVVNVEGGMNAWRSARLPVESKETS